ncbi:MAG: alpha/beta fold hydrolase [Pseudomonadota bacterium]
MRYALIIALTLAAGAVRAECVILLHGLARSEASLLVMEAAFEAQGYEVVRPGYPSTSETVQALADDVMPQALAACAGREVHVVTHSMGGILVRYWFDRHGVPDRLGRVVMMGPPNQGSEVVDELGDLAAFGWVNGPAGAQLGTGANSLPLRLPPVRYPVGVIAGNQSLNPYFSSLLPGPDDGKVSVAATRVDGMTSQLILPVTHTFMMNNPRVIVQALHFIETGTFKNDLSWLDALGAAPLDGEGDDDDDRN